jgi:hypothetical protein
MIGGCDGKAGWMADEPLEQLRRICMALPEVTERISHGEPSWFVREKKLFVSYANHHHDNRLAFWCAAPDGVQQMLVASNPDQFFVPPYVGHRGWLGVRLDVPTDWDEIEDLVIDSWRTVAPKRLVAANEGKVMSDE